MKYTHQRNIIRDLKVKYILFLLLIFFLLLKGISWLFTGVVIYYIIYRGILHLVTLIKLSFLRKAIKGLFLFLFLLSSIISLRLLVFDIYKIPSSSMESTLIPNDVIVVNKLKYGPRLPRSPFDIPWIKIAFYFNKKARDSMKVNWWRHRRLTGSSNVKNGDILVYENFRKNAFFVKRAVGIAGDTLNIKEGKVYINNIKHEFAKTIRNEYQFKVTSKKKLYRKLDSLNINEAINKSYSGFMKAELTHIDVKKIEKLECVDSLSQIIAPYKPEEKLFAEPKNKCWTTDNLGSVIIPQKGMKVILNDENHVIYNNVISLYEKVDIKKEDDSFLINGKRAVSYTFKQDYFFMMGDNRRGSYDSRFFGFLPKENIIGKVESVLFSSSEDKFRWDRFFKTIN